MLTFSDAHCHMHDGVLPASIVSYHRSVEQTIGHAGSLGEQALSASTPTETRPPEHLLRISPSPMVHSPGSQRAVQSILLFLHCLLELQSGSGQFAV